jgi:hypothetical protein
MSDQRCLICKYMGDHAHKSLSRDRIFKDGSGAVISIQLCYTHSWELFRFGQKKFLLSYRPYFEGFYGTEADAELIDFIQNDKNFKKSWAA